MPDRKHIIVQADRETGDWKYDTIEAAGTVDLYDHMRMEDTPDAFHTMHYVTPEIRANLPAGMTLDVESDHIIAVTIKMV